MDGQPSPSWSGPARTPGGWSSLGDGSPRAWGRPGRGRPEAGRPRAPEARAGLRAGFAGPLSAKKAQGRRLESPPDTAEGSDPRPAGGGFRLSRFVDGGPRTWSRALRDSTRGRTAGPLEAGGAGLGPGHDVGATRLPLGSRVGARGRSRRGPAFAEARFGARPRGNDGSAFLRKGARGGPGGPPGDGPARGLRLRDRLVQAPDIGPGAPPFRAGPILPSSQLLEPARGPRFGPSSRPVLPSHRTATSAPVHGPEFLTGPWAMAVPLGRLDLGPSREGFEMNLARGVGVRLLPFRPWVRPPPRCPPAILGICGPDSIRGQKLKLRPAGPEPWTGGANATGPPGNPAPLSETGRSARESRRGPAWTGGRVGFFLARPTPSVDYGRKQTSARTHTEAAQALTVRLDKS